MKKLVFALFLVITGTVSAQHTDSLLLGNWHLFKIIDNMTGNEIEPVKKKSDFQYQLSFAEDSLVKFNLEVNKCNNRYIILQKNQIKFLYYAECTEICCDKEFSELLTYEDCTNYYIKNGNTLILVSEDRIYYFSKEED